MPVCLCLRGYSCATLSLCVCTCVSSVCVNHRTICRIKEVLSYCTNSWDWIQVIRFSGKCLYPPNSMLSPEYSINILNDIYVHVYTHMCMPRNLKTSCQSWFFFLPCESQDWTQGGNKHLLSHPASPQYGILRGCVHSKPFTLERSNTNCLGLPQRSLTKSKVNKKHK